MAFLHILVSINCNTHNVGGIDAFFAGEPPSLTGEQGRAVLAFTLAAQESARLGRPVKVRE